MDDDLLSIGRFARLAGLSVGALRHYDDLDLLRPAEIDPFTGYRRYRTSQLEDAQTIARLRELEVPLEEIRDVLAADDPPSGRAGSTTIAPGSRRGPIDSNASCITCGASSNGRSPS